MTSPPAGDWTPESIRALRDADGNAPVHEDVYQTADPGRAERAIKLIFASGHSRTFLSKCRGPWVELTDD